MDLADFLLQIDLDWRDYLSITSTLFTIVAFAVTIYQLLQTKSAARAASESASKMLEESRTRFEDYSFANLIQYAAEIDQYTSREAWDVVTLRLNDLVRQAMQLGHDDPEWTELSDDILHWADTYQRMADGELKSTPTRRRSWADFRQKLKRKIAQRHGPFGQQGGG